MSTGGPLRVGLVGTGFMGKSHALAWRAVAATFGDLPAPELALLCDVDAAAAARWGAAWGFARTTTDWRALVADPGIDVVSITTPNGLHAPVAIAALEAGKHVWCEKPMATTLADAERMTAAAERAGRVTLLGYNYVRNPALAHARRLIADGAIGRVVDVRGRFDEDYLADAARPWSWRLRKADAGLGATGDMLCHLVALAHFLVGPVAAVSALSRVVHASRADETGKRHPVETEDLAHALVRFAAGAAGVFSTSRVAHGTKNALRIEIHGERGAILFDQERMNELALFRADGPEASRGFATVLTGPAHEPYALFCPAPGHQLGFNDLKTIEADALLRAIAGGPAAFPDFAAGLAIERVVHAVAAGAGRWVEL